MEVTSGQDPTGGDVPTPSAGAEPPQDTHVPRMTGEATNVEASSALATAPRGTIAEPIVVPNAVWAPADPKAYLGGRVPTVAHLAELEVGFDRSDNARWSGLSRSSPRRPTTSSTSSGSTASGRSSRASPAAPWR